MNYDYFYGQSGELFSYFRIPKALFQDSRFQQLSTDARTLYGILLDYFNKAVQPEWEELLKTPRYQPAASKRDAIEREFFRMLNDEQKRKYLDLESAVILAECDIAEAMYMKGAADREMMIR